MTKFTYTESNQFSADEAYSVRTENEYDFLGYVVKYGEIWWTYNQNFYPLSTHTSRGEAAESLYKAVKGIK